MENKIGYLGPKGTFTKMAVDALFNGGQKESFETIPECIDAVEADEIQIGVVPLENSIEGTVHLTIDYLVHEVRLPIIAEIVVPIEQHLLVREDFDQPLSSIKEIYSHSHAIAQCHQYLHKNVPDADFHFTSSTGRAAEIIAESSESIAAIGNELAATEYNLKMIDKNVHDYQNNHTRFAVLSKTTDPIKINDHLPSTHKTTLMVTLPSDYAGALHQVLSAFAWRKMNLSKIESRPMKTGLGNYFFLIDVNQPYDQVLFPGVQAEMEALGCKVNILGTYPAYKLSF